jgi:hypothetical protein
MDGLTGESKASGSFRGFLGIALMVLLLGAAVAGYLWWRSGFDGAQDPSAALVDVPPPEQQALAGAPASPTPEASASAAAMAVERVAEQQGGIESRLAAAEQRLTRLDLQAQAAAGNAARAEGLLIALAARRAIEKGAELGYLSDQLRLRFGDGWPNAVDTIISMSRSPVTLDKLVARLEGLEPELRNASEEPSFSWLRREIGELFIVRRETSPSPQPVRRMERARQFLESGRFEAAVEEVQNMPGAPAAEQWIADARRYAAAQRALDLIETAALLEQGRLRDGAGNAIGQPSPVQEITPPEGQRKPR